MEERKDIVKNYTKYNFGQSGHNEPVVRCAPMTYFKTGPLCPACAYMIHYSLKCKICQLHIN